MIDILVGTKSLEAVSRSPYQGFIQGSPGYMNTDPGLLMLPTKNGQGANEFPQVFETVVIDPGNFVLGKDIEDSVVDLRRFARDPLRAKVPL